jgi:peptidoglycan/LPS O-acetylase OafA/YrhL
VTASCSSAHERFLAKSYFPALDGLRCIAISAVVFHHSTPSQLPGWAGRGHLGVQLFFCISGFLITTLLLRERRSSGSISLKRFWIRRSLRIFPLYYAVLGLFTLGTALAAASPARSQFFGNLPFFASYSGNFWVNYGVAHPVIFGFSWSLATEEQFYVLWPPLLKAIRRVPLALLALISLLALDQFAERGGLSFALSRHGAAERVVTSFSGSVALGALLALVLDAPWGRSLANLLGHRAALPLLACLAFGLVLRPVEPFLCFELTLASLVAAAALRENRSRYELLSSAPLTFVGRASYGMYLFHVPVLGGLRRVSPDIFGPSGTLFAVAFALTLALASVSHRFFELPFLRLRSRFGAAGSSMGVAQDGTTREGVALGLGALAAGFAEEPTAVLELNRARVD